MPIPTSTFAGSSNGAVNVARETVVVTDRGRPVAQLTPPPREGIEDLVAGGVIRPGRGEVSPRFWDLPLPDDPDGKVLDSLLRERGEGR